MNSETTDCMACLYRRDGFEDGPTYKVHPGVRYGYSHSFISEVWVCVNHLDWLDFVNIDGEWIGVCYAGHYPDLEEA